MSPTKPVERHKALVVDRRLQQCTDAEFRRLCSNLMERWVFFGQPDWGRMPPSFQDEYARLCTEFQRRGIQLHLF